MGLASVKSLYVLIDSIKCTKPELKDEKNIIELFMWKINDWGYFLLPTGALGVDS